MAKGTGVIRSVVICGAMLGAWASPAAAAVVGTGTPASCNEAALDTAIAAIRLGGGSITFNCGGPATINVTSEKILYNPNAPTVTYAIDGGGVITINGQGLTRIILHLSGTLNISNITFTGGRARGVGDDASGGAIRSDRNPSIPNPVVLNLNNVTFTNNVADLTSPTPGLYPLDHGGGAVFLRLVNANIVNSRFTGNIAANCSGGAVHGRSAGIVVSGSYFGSNASNGGGLAGAFHVDGVGPFGPNGVLQITGSTFIDNSALNEGGAIFLFLHAGRGESAILDTVNIVGNRVTDSGRIDFVGNLGFGGGICTNNGSITIRNSTISNNSVRGTIATNGGGIGGGAALMQADAVTIVNSTISGNQALGAAPNSIGGGLAILDNAQPFTITHSTITLNHADTSGGGIQSLTNGRLWNTIVANNNVNTAFQGQCASQLTNLGGALQFPDTTPRCANAIIVANPLLGPLGGNGGFTQTHHPQPGSPVINAVGCAATTDQRGFARPQGSACEIGSVEVACSALSVNPLTLPTGRVGIPYSQVFSVSGGTGGVALSLTGTLPAGLTFTPGNGLLSGTPSQSGNFVITVGGIDTLACTAARTYNLTIASAVAVTPVALALDPLGNAVLEANETVSMEPSWINQTGAAVGLSGSLSSFIGPPASYTIADGSASYGTVANGATARCSTATGNCYVVAIGATARPAVHWDASVVESLSAGGPKSWTLHVGGSFTDVPASSPFYRFVETLLHRGITTGCSATAYCPTTGTTRDQMAVFVLVARQGPGYVPPACGTPMFPDVPASNPFCRWIEELARRGVVSGCGAGNYCPTVPVTRDQMAVFVLRTLDPTINPPACTTPMFADVPASNTFCRWIEELARRGVVSGCGGGNYCPGSAVTREQMGVFLTSSFGLTLYGP